MVRDGADSVTEGRAGAAGRSDAEEDRLLRERRLSRIRDEMIRVESPSAERDRAVAEEVTENGLLLAPFRRGGGWPASLPPPRSEEIPEWLERGVRALRAGLQREARGVLDAVGALLGGAADAGDTRADADSRPVDPTSGHLAPGECAVPLLRLADEWMRWTGRAGPVASLEPLLRACAARVEAAGTEVDAVATGGGEPATEGARDPSLLSHWIDDLLGVVPDASVGRLRLAPDLPPDWHHATVERLRMADARVHLRYRRDGGLRTFTLRQEEGRVPLNVVFEPLLPRRPGTVRVGGRPADPTLREEAGGVRVSLQFPLDPQREIAFDDAADADA